MDALIEKLSAADQGSRELDAEIKYLVHGECGCGVLCSPHYTTSLDAAMSLIPESWWLCSFAESRKPIIYLGDRHDPLGEWRAGVQRYEGGLLQLGHGKTAPLAICKAALMARRVAIPSSEAA